MIVRSRLGCRLHRVFAVLDREHGLVALRLFLEGVLRLPRREQVADRLEDFGLGQAGLVAHIPPMRRA